MLLAIDIGNSNITLGGFDAEALRFVSRLSTDCTATADEHAIRILQVLSLYRVESAGITDVIIASVVPPVNAAMRNAVTSVFHAEPIFVAPGIKTGLGIQCDMPSSVGADLICACVAANTLYGRPALIIDIGTATKMMLTNENGAFIGVSIMPGIAMGAAALAAGTAQLPNVSLEKPSSIIAKNTADCIRSGVVFGHASMIDGMIDRVFEEVQMELPICVTGGYASLVYPHCRHEMIEDSHLILKGLQLIHKKNK